ncbi:MAG: lysylphosphatidylglycerol synthase domain-containing protein [Pirellulaceae bacterium]|nr:lysylphosphatidylglycerol synthase domain-containing protein [Pirellulaceae bacterium]
MQLKKVLSTSLKILASAGMLGYLGVQAAGDPRFRELLAGEKNWPILICALPLCLGAVSLTILRWRLLLRTLGLEFSTHETLRAGFLGYLVNLMPFGLVGGDSLKAVMLIHRNPKRKTEAVATVVVDRVIGLYALLLLAAGASFFLPAEQVQQLAASDKAILQRLCDVVRASALISTLGLIVLLIPGITQLRAWDLVEHLPLVGGVLHKLVGAMRNYRRRVDRLLMAIFFSLGIHLLYVSSMALMTIGLGVPAAQRPAIGMIFVIVPPAMIAGALPIGAFEVVLNLLFRCVSPPGGPQNIGFLLALVYRVVQVLIASIGLAYWLTSRGEVRELLHEASDTPPEQDLAGNEPIGARA